MAKLYLHKVPKGPSMNRKKKNKIKVCSEKIGLFELGCGTDTIFFSKYSSLLLRYENLRSRVSESDLQISKLLIFKVSS